jgi:hypothetical protein
MALLVPEVHGATHRHQQVEALKVGHCIALIQLGRHEVESRRSQSDADRTRVLNG